MSVSPEKIIDLIGDLGREVYWLLDDCETSGDVGQEINTITNEGLSKVSAILDQIERLPFNVPGVILGPGAMLQEAIKQTFLPDSENAALIDVMKERARQQNDEGFTSKNDDAGQSGDLATAAACYALPNPIMRPDHSAPLDWPWSGKWWKPTSRRRDLVKAAALILAEIERIDRAKAAASEGAA